MRARRLLIVLALALAPSLALAAVTPLPDDYFMDEDDGPAAPTGTPTPTGTITRTFTKTPTPTRTPPLASPTFGCVKVFNVPRVGESSNADNRFVKQAEDAFPICCTYTRRMRHADRISSTQSSASVLSGTGCDTNVLAATGFKEQQAQVGVLGGTTGCSYKIRWVTQTVAGLTLVCDVKMTVRSDF